VDEMEAAIWRALTEAKVTVTDASGLVDDILGAARRWLDRELTAADRRAVLHAARPDIGGDASRRPSCKSG
jgi:hypothetical protein